MTTISPNRNADTLEEEVDAGRPHFSAAEFDVIPDTGCDIAPACLRCPLPSCKFDDPAAARRWRRGPRNRQIAARFEAGEPPEELARSFGISRRSVYRALAEARRSA